jgi:nucleoside triphosphate pyrophosphatase
MTLVLASTSPFRATILRHAGLEFHTDAAAIDERSVEAPLLQADATPADIAEVLAEAKAADVSARHAGALVLGCDQTLSLEGELFHKPANLEEARRHLLRFSGTSHELCSALALVKNGATVWRHSSVAYMHVRPLSPQFIGRYLSRAGEDVLKSVGAYQYEGLGIQLFERIDGDYFTIIGLPILPLLQKLREWGEIDG